MKPKIVLAEDDPNIARLTMFKLEKEGYEVIWEKDGGAALESIIKLKPDLVLLDVMMPVMDGYQVLTKIKENQTINDIPVIMLTAKGQGSDVVNGFEKGADEYIVKPFRPSDLIACIKKILNKK